MSAIDQAFIRAYQSAPAAAPVASVPTAGAPLATTAPPASRPAGHFGPPRPHFPPPAFSTGTAPAVAASIAKPAAPPSVAEPPSPRRPLSELVRPPQPVDAVFHPALEVDRFRYSSVVRRLTEQKRLWEQTLAVIGALGEDGRTVVGVAGAESAAGCTTAAICLARLAAATGKKTALVDADFVTAGLARQLGLSVELGWDDVLAGRVPLAEAAVYSLADGLTLLPLAAGGVPAAEKLDGVHGSITAGVLRYHHDLVLVDLGSAADEVQGVIARRVARQCRLDAVLLVDAGNGAADRLHLPPELADVALGVIENRSRGALRE
ncbi:MAG: hypothetical protein KDA44_03260 [Planctomycetales bacterium]|nr:hypothetical protein [Planctomycetales bacterium]